MVQTELRMNAIKKNDKIVPSILCVKHYFILADNFVYRVNLRELQII
jgi:hypothetical protein